MTRERPEPSASHEGRVARTDGRSRPAPWHRLIGSRARPRAWLPAFALALATLASLAPVYGCGKTLSDEDCGKVADNLRAIWTAEAKRAATAQNTPSDKGALVIKSEGDKLVADWTTECKRDLVGHRIDERDVTCLLQAKSIEQVNACGAR
jgi:hypothetical protein